MAYCPELDHLDREEQQLVAQLETVRASAGTAESEQFVFDRYHAVHRAYSALLTNPACADEALKRALFLQWFMVAEPPFLSGINGLDESSMRSVLAELERRAATGRTDEDTSTAFSIASDENTSPFLSDHLLGAFDALPGARPDALAI